MVRRLRARWIVPVTSAPIENGELVIENDTILEARALRVDGAPVTDAVDLGDAIIMPGLVNAHTHLEYTVMRGLIENVGFFAWVRELMARKAVLSPEDWRASAVMGALEAVAAGVTTVADCTDSGASLDGALALGMRGVVYQEVFGIDEELTVEETVGRLRVKVNALRKRAEGTYMRVGISPHAPYTVRPALFTALMTYAREEGLGICIHAAESEAEVELIGEGTGEFADMFARRGIRWDVPGGTSVAYLASLGALTPTTLLAHGVYITPDDVAIIRDTGAAWVHCPKSNAKLGNGISPFDLLRKGYADNSARVGLGSDSVASNNTIDLFEEMRFAVLAQRANCRDWQAMSARDAVETATIGGARALGMELEIGSLEAGKRADVTVVRLGSLAATPCYDPYSALVYSCGARDVALTMVSGETLYMDGVFTNIDLATVRAIFADTVAKVTQTA